MAKGSLSNIFNLIKQAEDSIPCYQAFLNDLIATIRINNTQRKPSKTYKPSSMNCIRNMYYQIQGEEVKENSRDEQLISMADVGSHRHEFLQEHVQKMKDNGIECEWVDVGEYLSSIDDTKGTVLVEKKGYEFKCFNEKLNLSFLCDGIIKYKGEIYILEIKTEGSFKWQKREDVDPKHKTQACCYSYCFSIPKVLFIYEDRDNLGKKSYIYEPTRHEIEELVLNKIQKCNEYVKNSITPPKTENKRECAYCSYVNICRKEG